MKKQQPAPPRSDDRVQDRPRRAVDRAGVDVVDLWGLDSFPASDAPANW
jgi:hypothetical protein